MSPSISSSQSSSPVSFSYTRDNPSPISTDEETVTELALETLNRPISAPHTPLHVSTPEDHEINVPENPNTPIVLTDSLTFDQVNQKKAESPPQRTFGGASPRPIRPISSYLNWASALPSEQ